MDLKGGPLAGADAAVAAALRDPRQLAEVSAASVSSLARAAEAHGVAGLLLHRAMRAGVSLGPDWASLRDYAAGQRAAATLRNEESRRVLNGANLVGIPVVALKGLALAHSVYPHSWMRPRSDTDLLVHQDDLPRVDRHFREAGYRLVPHLRGAVTMPQQHYSREDATGFQHNWDVHWRLTSSQALGDALSEEEVWARAQQLTRLDGARAPAHPDALLLACIHRLAHHFDDPRLIWLWDIRLLLEVMDDDERERFARLASRPAAAAACGHSLAVARDLCGASLSGPLLPLLDAASTGGRAAFLWSGSRRRVSYLIGELRAAPPRRALRVLRERLLPSLASMRERYPSVPRLLLPLAYPWRLIAGIPKWFSAR